MVVNFTAERKRRQREYERLVFGSRKYKLNAARLEKCDVVTSMDEEMEDIEKKTQPKLTSFGFNPSPTNAMSNYSHQYINHQ